MFLSFGPCLRADSTCHTFQSTPDTTDAFSLGPFPGNPVFVANGGLLIVYLTWDDTFGSTTSDYDLWLIDELTSQAVDVGGDDNLLTNEPFEFVVFFNQSGIGRWIDVVIENFLGVQPVHIMEMFVFGGVTLPNGTEVNYNTLGSSVPGQSDAGGGVVSAGAIDASDPGVDEIESYSSQGPANNGALKPDITAIDGVAITGSGGFPVPFFGTSAAAPHVAGLAALLLEVNPELLSGQEGDDPAADRAVLRSAITGAATDLGAFGVDNIYGSGLVDGLLAGQLLEPIAAAPVSAAVVSIDAPASVESGSTFTAQISIDAVASFGSGQLDVSFDPTVLTIDNISPGAGITSGLIGGTTIGVLNTGQVSAGTVSMRVNVPGGVGASGSGPLAEINFRVIGSAGSSSAITPLNVLLGDAEANEVSSTTSGTTIGVSDALPTATPVPTATATPLPPATSTPPPTATPVPAATETATPLPTATPVSTATSTPPPTATPVPMATETATPLPTATPVSTATATPLPTATSVSTATATPLPTVTPVPTATATPSGVLVSVDAPSSVATGGSFTALVDIGQVAGLDSGQFDVSFDSTVLTIDDITPGIGVADGDIGGTAIPIVATSERSSVSPTRTVRVVFNVPGISGLSGSGSLGDSTTISLMGLLLGDTVAQLIESVPGPATITVTADCQAGDANQDGIVDALDITAIELIVAGTLPETPCADANGDGGVNALDVTVIELLVAGSS